MSNSGQLLVKNVRLLLAERNWLSQDLAKAAKMATSQLSDYLSGKSKPSLEVIERLAAALNVSVAELLTPAGQKEKTLEAQSLSPTEAALLGAIRSSGGDPRAKVLLDSLLAGQRYEAQKAELAKKKA